MIEIRPTSPNMVEVLFEGSKVLDALQDEITENMEDFADAYPGMTQVILRANGFRITTPVIDKALELTSIVGLTAAKQIATGKVVF